ncbi:MAG: PfkB family carbohydrate kinase [Candidatus Kryptoniota bacterium]
MTTPRVVTFGELLLRLSTSNYQRISQASAFEIHFGGAEANVAVSLANFGINSCYVTRLPENEIAELALRELQKHNVDTGFIVRGGPRIGIYFLETGVSQRPSRVIYDRANSSISQVKRGMINWQEVLSGSSWFHLSGITPALGDNVADVCMEALSTAKKSNITVSLDLNYRKKLWSLDKAKSVIHSLLEYVDILISNEEDIGLIFETKLERPDFLKGEMSAENYTPLAKEILSNFNLKMLGITLRESISASENNWSGALFDGTKMYVSRKYKINVVDRVGTGDSFAAGLIYGILTKQPPQDALDFAVAASCLKHTIHGDFNFVTLSEVEELKAGNTSGRVQR